MLRIVDPSTGDLVGEVEETADAAIVAAVGGARAAYPTWRQTPAAERGTALRRVAASVAADAESLAELNARETGRAVGVGRASRRFALSQGRSTSALVSATSGVRAWEIR